MLNNVKYLEITIRMIFWFALLTCLYVYLGNSHDLLGCISPGNCLDHPDVWHYISVTIMKSHIGNKLSLIGVLLVTYGISWAVARSSYLLVKK